MPGLGGLGKEVTARACWLFWDEFVTRHLRSEGCI